VKPPVVLDLCGGTGAWSEPYRAAGYDVRLVTLPEHDVRTWRLPEDVVPNQVFGVLFAPPCTEYAVSGARWWAAKSPALLHEALLIVDAGLSTIRYLNPTWWAMENPVGRLRTLRPELGAPRLIFNPNDYGDPWTKKTLVWGRFNLPAKSPVPAKEFWGWRHLGGKSERTKRLRSVTPPGFSRAFFAANQHEAFAQVAA
jgi:hypothetical protein